MQLHIHCSFSHTHSNPFPCAHTHTHTHVHHAALTEIVCPLTFSGMQCKTDQIPTFLRDRRTFPCSQQAQLHLLTVGSAYRSSTRHARAHTLKHRYTFTDEDISFSILRISCPRSTVSCIPHPTHHTQLIHAKHAFPARWRACLPLFPILHTIYTLLLISLTLLDIVSKTQSTRRYMLVYTFVIILVFACLPMLSVAQSTHAYTHTKSHEKGLIVMQQCLRHGAQDTQKEKSLSIYGQPYPSFRHAWTAASNLGAAHTSFPA